MSVHLNSTYKHLLLIVLLQLSLLLTSGPALAEEISVSGFTEATKDSTLGVSATGRVAEILVRAGDTVKQGQALIRLEQKLEQLEEKRRKVIWEGGSEISALIRQLQTLKRHLSASHELHQISGSITQEDIDHQELEVALTQIEIERLQINKNREKLEFQIASQQLADKTIKAPFSGQVVEVLVGTGENCDLDTPLLRLVDTRHIEFVGSTELAVSQRLKIGQDVELLFETGQDALDRSGKISYISPVVDPASGLRKIKASFDNQDQSITPGEAGIMIFTP